MTSVASTARASMSRVAAAFSVSRTNRAMRSGRPGRRLFQWRLRVDAQTLVPIRRRPTPFHGSASLLAQRGRVDANHVVLGRSQTRLGDVGRRSVA